MRLGDFGEGRRTARATGATEAFYEVLRSKGRCGIGNWEFLKQE